MVYGGNRRRAQRYRRDSGPWEGAFRQEHTAAAPHAALHPWTPAANGNGTEGVGWTCGPGRQGKRTSRGALAVEQAYTICVGALYTAWSHTLHDSRLLLTLDATLVR
jgi:hypothetical protein